MMKCMSVNHCHIICIALGALSIKKWLISNGWDDNEKKEAKCLVEKFDY